MPRHSEKGIEELMIAPRATYPFALYELCEYYMRRSGSNENPSFTDPGR
jgi:hypothetical protein